MPLSSYSLYHESEIAFLALEWDSTPSKESDFLIRYANAAAAELLSVPADQLTGHSLIALFPQPRSKWLEISHVVTYQNYPYTYCGQLLQNGRRLYLDVYSLEDGTYGCVISEEFQRSAMCLLGATQPPTADTIRALERDYIQLLTKHLHPLTPEAETAEPVSAREAQLLYQCNLLLADASLSFDEAMDGLLEQLSVHFGAQTAFGLLLADGAVRSFWPKGKAQQLPASLLAKPLQSSFTLWEKVTQERSYLLLDNAESPPPALRNFADYTGIHTLLQIPIQGSDGFSGMLGFVNTSCDGRGLWLLRPLFDNLARLVECRRLMEKSHRLETTDRLTGQLNFAGFSARGEQLIDNYPNRKYAMLYCDIRRFKYINEDYSYEVGDKLLHYWAYCLDRLCRNGDIFCRVTADNMIILRWYHEEAELESFFQTMLASVNRFPLFTQKSTTIEIVCGVYLLKQEDMATPDISKMMDRASIAQKAAKATAGTSFAYYNNAQRDQQLREVEIVQSLQAAIKAGEIYLVYQPQYNYADRRIIGAEALVRWKHHSYGELSPGEFIPILEKNNLVHILDQYVWEEACRYIRSLLNGGFTDQMVPISVNISRLDINMLELTALFPTLLEKYGLENHRLTLEITESAYLDTPSRLIQTVNGLRELGFSVEMDDFGSGYSSLNSLKEVSVDVLKLDMKFLEDSDTARGGNILSSVIRMANWMNLAVIAEGVETAEQADYLKAVGCSIMQGYLFSRPINGNVLANLLWDNEEADLLAKKGQTFQLDLAEFLSTKGDNSYLFHHCIGGACILEYNEQGGSVEALLYNDKYPEEVGISFAEADRLRTGLEKMFPEQVRVRMLESLRIAKEERTNALEVTMSGQGRSGRTLRFQHHYLESRGQRHMYFCLVEDISKQFAAQENLEQVSRGFQSVVDLFPAGLCRVADDGDYSFNFISTSLLTMLGYTEKQVEQQHGNSFLQLVCQEDRQMLHSRHQAMTRHGDIGFFDYRVQDAKGEPMWVSGESRLYVEPGGERWFYVILKDLENQDKAMRSMRWQTAQYHALMHVEDNVIFDYAVTEDTFSIQRNSKDAAVTETVLEQYLQQEQFPWVHPDDQQLYEHGFRQALCKAGRGTLTYRACYFGEEYCWCRLRFTSLEDSHGVIYRLVGMAEEIREEALLRQLACCDTVTGLLNREATVQFISDSLQSEGTGALFLVNMDNFATVNQLHSRTYGDNLLKKTARILRNTFRDNDIVGRLGEDEFLIFLPGLCEETKIAQKANDILRCIQKIQVPGMGMASASIGIAYNLQEQQEDYAQLFTRATGALKSAKNAGKCRYEIAG